MKSSNYGEEIDKQKLEIYCDETVLKVSGNTNIIKYCHNSKYNSKNFEWYKNKVISKDIVDDLLDSKLNFYSIKSNLSSDASIPVNWNDIRKFYKITKKIKYTDPDTNIKYIVSITKGNGLEYDEANDTDMYYNLNYSGILSSTQKYEFYIDIKKQIKIIYYLH